MTKPGASYIWALVIGSMIEKAEVFEMAKSALELEFDAAMIEIYLRAKMEANYTASIFYQMLDRQRGLATAKQLINDLTISQGYAALWERGRLDLTVEAVVFENSKWHPLFDNTELERARKRLHDYDYFKRDNPTD